MHSEIEQMTHWSFLFEIEFLRYELVCCVRDMCAFMIGKLSNFVHINSMLSIR